ncbi:MAG: MFS transporter, partial [Solirubrobacteraceae bacterium]
EETGEVGGLQNTLTNLGASIGTALSGAVLISALTASLATGIQNNPEVPDRVKSEAQTQLVSGVAFISDKDLQSALDEAGVSPMTADAIVEENADARLDALRSSLSVIGIIALIAMICTFGIPERQPAAESSRVGPDPGGQA